MEDITLRLNEIINKNTDFAFNDSIYLLDNTTLFFIWSQINKINNANRPAVSPENVMKNAKAQLKQHEISKRKRFADKILFSIISDFEDPQVRQILFLHNLCLDFKDYSINNRLLFNYYEKLKTINLDIPGYRNEKESVCSPLYVLCIYLRVVYRFLEKIDVNDIRIYPGVIDKIAKLLNSNNEESENNKSDGIIIKNYLFEKCDDVNKNINKLLNLLAGINSIPSEKYFEYLDKLKSIVSIYYKIFFEEAEKGVMNMVSKYADYFKNIPAIKFFKIGSICQLNIDIVNQIEKCSNDIDILVKNTRRDLT
jgi:hypothetical protein